MLGDCRVGGLNGARAGFGTASPESVHSMDFGDGHALVGHVVMDVGQVFHFGAVLASLVLILTAGFMLMEYQLAAYFGGVKA